MAEMKREPKFSANELKSALWETLQQLRAGVITPQQAQAVASQAREITRVINLQLSVLKLAEERPDNSMLEQCGLSKSANTTIEISSGGERPC